MRSPVLAVPAKLAQVAHLAQMELAGVVVPIEPVEHKPVLMQMALEPVEAAERVALVELVAPAQNHPRHTRPEYSALPSVAVAVVLAALVVSVVDKACCYP